MPSRTSDLIRLKSPKPSAIVAAEARSAVRKKDAWKRARRLHRSRIIPSFRPAEAHSKPSPRLPTPWGHQSLTQCIRSRQPSTRETRNIPEGARRAYQHRRQPMHHGRQSPSIYDLTDTRRELSSSNSLYSFPASACLDDRHIALQAPSKEFRLWFRLNEPERRDIIIPGRAAARRRWSEGRGWQVRLRENEEYQSHRSSILRLEIKSAGHRNLGSMST